MSHGLNSKRRGCVYVNANLVDTVNSMLKWLIGTHPELTIIDVNVEEKDTGMMDITWPTSGPVMMQTQ